jgi:NAD(P)-dependent dehydrogenase (short-subunit alcohol dehydrogenase family)
MIGKAQEMGRDEAEHLAALEAVVVVADQELKSAERVAKSIQEFGGRAHALAVDSNDAKSVRAMYASIRTEIGHVDLLIENADSYSISRINPFTQIERMMGAKKVSDCTSDSDSTIPSKKGWGGWRAFQRAIPFKRKLKRVHDS